MSQSKQNYKLNIYGFSRSKKGIFWQKNPEKDVKKSEKVQWQKLNNNQIHPNWWVWNVQKCPTARDLYAELSSICKSKVKDLANITN